jgi:hypothetical protein
MQIARGQKPLSKSIAVSAILALALCIGGCGGSGGGSSPTASASPTPTPTTAAATTHLSDPASQCSGLYSHVFVTVSDVQASTSGSGTGGFVDLTPGLSTHPIQVDLMAEPVNECFLAQLGINSGLPAGNYQQIRFILLANNAPGVVLAGGASNQCGGNNGPWNCVVQVGSSMSNELSLPSEAQTGIKIPPGQIAGGGIELASGESVDIDIDFNACTSVVEAGKSGKFLLKPTLRASEVGTNPLIAGTIVSATAGGGGVITPDPSVAIPNANVWLEQEPTAPNFTVGNPGPGASATPSVAVENLVQTTTADSNGHFEFCPVGPGTYDVVADAQSLPGSGLPSTATVAADATVTSSGGPNNLVIPLVAESVADPAAAWGQISAIVSTVNASAPGDDVMLTGLQAFTPPGGEASLQALTPLFYDPAGSDGTMPGSVPPVVTTEATFSDANCPALSSVTSCPAGTNCACFNLAVPVGDPVVGSANATGNGYVAPATAKGYAIGAIATTLNGSSSDLICAPPALISNPAATFPVTAGSVTTPTNPVLQFAGCD